MDEVPTDDRSRVSAGIIVWMKLLLDRLYV